MPKLDESITLQPKVLRWARERAGLEREQLAANLKLQTQDIAEGEHSGRITFNEVDDLAKYTYPESSQEKRTRGAARGQG